MRDRAALSCKHRRMPTEMTVSLTPKSEHGALENFLDPQRIGLIRKVEGVSDELARQAPTASSLSLLGLMKHAATWELRWFQVIMAGRQSPDLWPEVMPEPHDAELILRDSDTVTHWIAVYREPHRDVERDRRLDGPGRSLRANGHHRVPRALCPVPHDRGDRAPCWPRRHRPRDARRSTRHLKRTHAPNVRIRRGQQIPVVPMRVVSRGGLHRCRPEADRARP